MLGLTLALAAGAHRRHGWALPATAAVAAALPDWDAAAIVFGGEAFSRVHRVWGHNLLCAGLLGALTGGVGYWCYLSVRVRKKVGSWFSGAGATPSYGTSDLAVWVLHGQGDWDEEKVEQAMNDGPDNKTVSLKTPLPIAIFYLTAIASEDGHTHFFDDIYGYDAEMQKDFAKGPPYPIKPERIVPKTKAGDTA